MKQNKIQGTRYKVQGKKVLSTLYLLPFTMYLLSACSDPVLFEQKTDLPNSKWSKEGIVHVTLPVTDSLNYYNLILTLRNAENYPYRNIFLFVTTTAPNGAMMRDTVQYELADERGQWLGKSGRHWIDHRLLYRSNTRFIQAGDYQLSIQHGMRNDTLQGVGAVGLRVEKQ